MGITHDKVSGLPNPADPSLVGGEDWDAEHVIDLQDADIPASIARDAEVTAAVAAEALLARNADNLTSGTVADARIAATIARDSELTAAIAALSTVYQPLDGDLTAIAALSTTAYGRAFLELANAGAARTALALGTAATSATGDFDAAGAAAAAQAASQPLDADLTAIAALTTTAFGRGLLELANAGAGRTAFGLGTAATAANGDFDAAGAAAAAQAASQPLDADLTAIAGLTPSNDDIVQRKAGAWTNRTVAQLLTDLAAPGTTFQPLDSDLTAIAALTTTAFGRSLLEAANAAALRTLAGTVIGTDVRAQGGGDPTRASLGLDTTDSPQFAGVNVGAATDTTVTRSAAGVIAVEGKDVQLVGGADVLVADGGTGASDASGARTNLGLVIGTDVPGQAAFDDHSARHEDGGADEISIAGLSGTSAALQAHLDDATDAHDASAISFTPAGSIASTDVQAAIEEVAAEAINPTFASYTPALTASTTNPTLGSGSSISGRYVQVGKLVVVQIIIIFGSSGVNAGSGTYNVSLPINAALTSRMVGGGFGFDSSAGTFAVFAVQGTGSVGIVQLLRDAAPAVTNAGPWTWAAGDQIHMNLSYESA